MKAANNNRRQTIYVLLEGLHGHIGSEIPTCSEGDLGLRGGLARWQ